MSMLPIGPDSQVDVKGIARQQYEETISEIEREYEKGTLVIQYELHRHRGYRPYAVFVSPPSSQRMWIPLGPIDEILRSSPPLPNFKGWDFSQPEENYYKWEREDAVVKFIKSKDNDWEISVLKGNSFDIYTEKSELVSAINCLRVQVVTQSMRYFSIHEVDIE
ncbi:hypothetical protein EGH22_00275 [Halomicroarcula sp. F28]|uniref:hypothetical protein n=1 Tax=Haloarcula salinisoli TaxID=2487746 RepID=UPI001C72E5EE|nr:hypothetical protein [Halomicroarcula salinisoli]MBX0284752.1 hypothetical protein [Halomicroarcula salinisoli]